MQYFEEFNKELIIPSNFGLLKYVDNDYYVNDILINNKNRALPNDIVYLKDNNIVGIKEHSKKKIVGIIDPNSKIKYGNINGKTLFLFKPTNKSYPDFYVAYIPKNNVQYKIYIIIEFLEWKTTQKNPMGKIIDNIGQIGVEEVEYEHLRHYYEIVNNNWNIDKNKISTDQYFLDQINNNEPLYPTNYEIFSIDPPLSKDIDDAFHYKETETYYEVGIHIANPNILLENSLNRVLERVSTVYLPTKKYNMIPSIYANNFISLLQDTKRCALSLIIQYNKKYEVIFETIEQTTVKISKNYNYEEFNEIYNSHKNLKEFVEFSKAFFKSENLTDSHKLVEYWMIYANQYVANYLIKKDYKNIILRKHDEGNHILLNDIMNIDQSLKNYLITHNENAALYEIYDKSNNTTHNYKHSKLGNDYYTHFTSPIRRAVDFFIHKLLLNQSDIYEQKDLQKYVDKINQFTKNTRKFDRVVKKLSFLFKINDNNHDKELITYAYVISIKDYKIRVFIPEYNLEEDIIIVSHKFKKIAIINKEIDDKTLELKKINVEIDDFKINFELYQKINIKLWVFISAENIFDKLKIEII
jgi:exoribonuclease R